MASGYIISLIPRPGVQSSPIVYTHTTHPGDAVRFITGDRDGGYKRAPHRRTPTLVLKELRNDELETRARAREDGQYGNVKFYYCDTAPRRRAVGPEHASVTELSVVEIYFSLDLRSCTERSNC